MKLLILNLWAKFTHVFFSTSQVMARGGVLGQTLIAALNSMAEVAVKLRGQL